MDDVIGKLTAEQALKIVGRLVRKGGALRDAVIAEAMAVLSDIEADETADQVVDALDAIDVEECWDRSGSSRDGYTSPVDAAAELVDEALQPFLDQAERYHQLGLIDQEETWCQGVILGIYRFERESGSEFRQWSEDICGECAGFLLGAWRDRNRDQARLAAMRAFVRERCPHWADRLKGWARSNDK